MNFSNIWQHPKTSIAGVLICVVTVAGVLSQQGITLGNAGTGTIVALVGAIATALLGLLSQDGASSSSANSTAKFGALALIALLFIAPFETGCTQAQKVSVAQEIVNWTPVFISTADTVATSIEALDPVTSMVLMPLVAGINAFGPEFQKAAQNYLANPSQTTLQVLQALVVQIQQDTSAALLAAAKITNPGSQALATKDIGLVATVINTILALVQSISSKAQLAAMAAHAPITLAMIRPYLDKGQMQMAAMKVQRDLDLPGIVTPDSFFAAEAQAGF